MSLREIAVETRRIVEEGAYRAPSGVLVSIRDQVAAAVAGTRLVRPDDALPAPARTASRTLIEVTGEKTGDAARRLAALGSDIALLNFASAKNPGGGFVTGAKAQEEDLARCSALYACLVKKREYYDANRAWPDLLYSDHVIYSPRVPFFRDDALELLEVPFLASVITAPAPNAGEELRRDPGAGARIEAALRRRAHRVLAIATNQGHSVLVLGAWGCGVFRNDPRLVADAFAEALAAHAGAFGRVVFAVWERSGNGPNLRAFRERFAAT
jgi:uncharacterized protein (TIGR02452 family)